MSLATVYSRAQTGMDAPLLDQIDIHIDVPRAAKEQLKKNTQ